MWRYNVICIYGVLTIFFECKIKYEKQRSRSPAVAAIARRCEFKAELAKCVSSLPPPPTSTGHRLVGIYIIISWFVIRSNYTVLLWRSRRSERLGTWGWGKGLYSVGPEIENAGLRYISPFQYHIQLISTILLKKLINCRI